MRRVKTKATSPRAAAMPHNPQQAALLTRRDLCDRWKVSSEFCKRREAARVLTAIKLGGRSVRYRLAEIEQIEAQAEVRR